MKLRFHIILSTLLLLSSCAKEMPEAADSGSGAAGKMEFLIVAESGKTVLSGLTVRPEVGDEIAIWDGVAVRKFIGVQSGDVVVFRGDAVQADEYWALYPWSDGCSVDASGETPVFSTTVPKQQHARASSFGRGAAVCIGKTSSPGVIFLKNVCGFLKLGFQAAAINIERPGTLTSVSLTSSGQKLAGTVNVTLDSSGTPVATGAFSEGDDRVTLCFDNEIPAAGTDYVFCALPADLNGGIELDFKRSADCAKAVLSGGVGKGNVIQANVLKTFGTISPDWKAVMEEAADSTPDPVGSFDYAALAATSHPRVFMCDEDFRLLKKYLDDGTYPILTSRHLATLSQADAYCGKEFPTLAQIETDYPAFQYQKNRHRELVACIVLGHLFCCSYAYRTTGDAKYLTECRRTLNQICADAHWYPDSFLSTGEISLGVAIAYDWLYYDLTLEERQMIHSNLKAKGILARKSGTLGAKNNTGQVHNAGLMAAALAIYEKDKTVASALMEESISKIPDIIDYIYGVKGSTYEGYGYWSYGTTFQCIYNECLMTAFGTLKGIDTKPGFHQTGDYLLHMTDHISPFGYCDGGRTSPSGMPAMWWLAAYYGRPDYLFNEIYRENIGSGIKGREMAMIPCTLAKYPKMETQSLPCPTEDVWIDSNDAVSPVIMVRTGWTNSDSDHFLGLKGGKANVNHGHMDVGAFSYNAYGKAWATDVAHKTYSEYTLHGLNGREQTGGTWKAMCYNSLGHSTISFANYSGSIAKNYPTDHMVNGKATILESYTSGQDLGAKLDLTPLFTGQVQSATRKAVIRNRRDLVIEDRISALSSADAQLIWCLVTPASVELKENNIALHSESRNMYLTMTCTEGAVNDFVKHYWGTFKESRPVGGQWGWNDVPTWDEEHDAFVTGFTLTIPAGTTVTLQTTLSAIDPTGTSADTTGETPSFDDGQYNW